MPPNASTRSRFALTGPSVAVDPRTHAVRRDLADIRLADRIFAPHYAAAVPRSVRAASPIRTAPAANAPILSEILPGERFDLLETSNNVAWGVCAADGVVGYLDAAVLVPFDAQEPVVQSPNTSASDAADIAQTLIGVPYQQGGRSHAGVDPAGLIFFTLATTGIPVPRFLDLQSTTVGHALERSTPPTRGDLVYFDAHAAMMADAITAIHVPENGLVTLEPLTAITARYGEPTALRRPA